MSESMMDKQKADVAALERRQAREECDRLKRYIKSFDDSLDRMEAAVLAEYGQEAAYLVQAYRPLIFSDILPDTNDLTENPRSESP